VIAQVFVHHRGAHAGLATWGDTSTVDQGLHHGLEGGFDVGQHGLAQGGGGQLVDTAIRAQHAYALAPAAQDQQQVGVAR